MTAFTSSSSTLFGRLRLDPWRDGVTLLCGLLLVYLIIVPLVLLVYGSLTGEGASTLSLARYTEAFRDPRSYRLLLNSVIYAGGVASIALVIGGITAWLLQRTDVPAKGFFIFLALAPAFMPPVLIVLSWVLLLDGNIGLVSRFLQELFGTSEPLLKLNSLAGMIWVGGILDVPLAFLWMWPAFAAMDPSLEEAAAMSRARPLRILRTITLPLIWPALVAAFLVSFVLAIEDITVPILIGLPGQVHVFATDIYLAHTQLPPDTTRASALSVILLVITIGLILLYRRLTAASERYAIVRGKGYRPSTIELGRYRLPATLFLVVVFAIIVGLPLLILIWTSLSPYLQVPSLAGMSGLSFQWYLSVFDDPNAIRGITNSLIAGLGSAVAVMVLAVIVAWAVIRSGRRIWAALDILTFLPIAIPGLVIGLGLIWLYLPMSLPIYGTLTIVWIAYVTKFIPYGVRLAYAGVRQLHPELEEASYVSGASWGRTMRQIYLPLLVPTIGAGLLYTTMRAFRELPASLLLVSYGNETYSVSAYNMWSAGEPGKTAAYGVIVIVVMTAILAVTWELARRRFFAAPDSSARR